jgi:hypothetical protein
MQDLVINPLPLMPPCVTAAPAEGLAGVSFRSGAMLAHLGQVMARDDLPLALWRDRLALAAGVRAVALAGRRETMADLRDAVHLTRPGDDPGPAGRIYARWRQLVARPVPRAADLGTAETPVDIAADMIAAMLADDPRAEAEALMAADLALAQGLGWTHPVPLLALGLRPRDLRLTGDDLCLACHRALQAGIKDSLPVATQLTRAAAKLRHIAPKLRAKTAPQAVELFLARDALAPWSLDFMSDRAARRLCDRLVSLGALRELTGRDTFRLYGL